MDLQDHALTSSTLRPVMPFKNRLVSAHRSLLVGRALNQRSGLIHNLPVNIQRNSMRGQIIYVDLMIIIRVCPKSR